MESTQNIQIANSGSFVPNHLGDNKSFEALVVDISKLQISQASAKLSNQVSLGISEGASVQEFYQIVASYLGNGHFDATQTEDLFCGLFQTARALQIEKLSIWIEQVIPYLGGSEKKTLQSIKPDQLLATSETAAQLKEKSLAIKKEIFQLLQGVESLETLETAAEKVWWFEDLFFLVRLFQIKDEITLLSTDQQVVILSFIFNVFLDKGWHKEAVIVLSYLPNTPHPEEDPWFTATPLRQIQQKCPSPVTSVSTRQVILAKSLEMLVNQGRVDDVVQMLSHLDEPYLQRKIYTTLAWFFASKGDFKSAESWGAHSRLGSCLIGVRHYKVRHLILKGDNDDVRDGVILGARDELWGTVVEALTEKGCVAEAISIARGSKKKANDHFVSLAKVLVEQENLQFRSDIEEHLSIMADCRPIFSSARKEFLQTQYKIAQLFCLAYAKKGEVQVALDLVERLPDIDTKSKAMEMIFDLVFGHTEESIVKKMSSWGVSDKRLFLLIAKAYAHQACLDKTVACTKVVCTKAVEYFRKALLVRGQDQAKDVTPIAEAVTQKIVEAYVKKNLFHLALLFALQHNREGRLLSNDLVNIALDMFCSLVVERKNFLEIIEQLTQDQENLLGEPFLLSKLLHAWLQKARSNSSLKELNWLLETHFLLLKKTVPSPKLEEEKALPGTYLPPLQSPEILQNILQYNLESYFTCLKISQVNDHFNQNIKVLLALNAPIQTKLCIESLITHVESTNIQQKLRTIDGEAFFLEAETLQEYENAFKEIAHILYETLLPLGGRSIRKLSQAVLGNDCWKKVWFLGDVLILLQLYYFTSSNVSVDYRTEDEKKRLAIEFEIRIFLQLGWIDKTYDRSYQLHWLQFDEFCSWDDWHLRLEKLADAGDVVEENRERKYFNQRESPNKEGVFGKACISLFRQGEVKTCNRLKSDIKVPFFKDQVTENCCKYLVDTKKWMEAKQILDEFKTSYFYDRSLLYLLEGVAQHGSDVELESVAQLASGRLLPLARSELFLAGSKKHLAMEAVVCGIGMTHHLPEVRRKLAQFFPTDHNASITAIEQHTKMMDNAVVSGAVRLGKKYIQEQGWEEVWSLVGHLDRMSFSWDRGEQPHKKATLLLKKLIFAGYKKTGLNDKIKEFWERAEDLPREVRMQLTNSLISSMNVVVAKADHFANLMSVTEDPATVGDLCAKAVSYLKKGEANNANVEDLCSVYQKLVEVFVDKKWFDKAKELADQARSMKCWRDSDLLRNGYRYMYDNPVRIILKSMVACGQLIQALPFFEAFQKEYRLNIKDETDQLMEAWLDQMPTSFHTSEGRRFLNICLGRDAYLGYF